MTRIIETVLMLDKKLFNLELFSIVSFFYL